MTDAGMAAALCLVPMQFNLELFPCCSFRYTAHDNFKASVLKAKDIDTVITGQNYRALYVCYVINWQQGNLLQAKRRNW